MVWKKSYAKNIAEINRNTEYKSEAYKYIINWVTGRNTKNLET